MKTQQLKEYDLTLKALFVIFIILVVNISIVLFLPRSYENIHTATIGIFSLLTGIIIADVLPIWVKSNVEGSSLSWRIGGKPAKYLLIFAITGLTMYSYSPIVNLLTMMVHLIGYMTWMTIVGIFLSQEMNIWRKVETFESVSTV